MGCIILLSVALQINIWRIIMWDNIFNLDNPIYRFFSRLVDLVILTVLWIICSIPIFTIGASTTALYYTSINSISREDGYIAKMFFRSFGRNFRQATAIWGIMFLLGAILGGDVYCWFTLFNNTGAGYTQVMLVVSLILFFIYLMGLIYVFPVLSKFDNTVKATIKNAYLLSIKHLDKTILIMIVPGIVVAGILLTNVYWLPFILLFMGLIAFIQAYIFKNTFKSYMEEDSENGEVAAVEDISENGASADVSDATEKEE